MAQFLKQKGKKSVGNFISHCSVLIFIFPRSSEGKKDYLEAQRIFTYLLLECVCQWEKILQEHEVLAKFYLFALALSAERALVIYYTCRRLRLSVDLLDERVRMLTSPFSLRIRLLKSLPSKHRKSSPGFRIPHFNAIARAVLMLSPVTIRTVMPARWHFFIASGTCQQEKNPTGSETSH